MEVGFVYAIVKSHFFIKGVNNSGVHCNVCGSLLGLGIVLP